MVPQVTVNATSTMNAAITTNSLGTDLLEYNVDLLGWGALVGLFAIAALGPLGSRIGSEAVGAAFVAGSFLVVGWLSSFDDLAVVLAATAAYWAMAMLTSRRSNSEALGTRPFGGDLLAISLLGVFAAVPDTEGPMLVLGYSVPCVLALCLNSASTASGRYRFDPKSSYLLPALVVVAALCRTSGTDQWIGGLCCLGVLIPSRFRSVGPAIVCSSRWSVVVTHIGVVIVGSRVITRWDAALALPVAAGLLLVASMVSLPSERLST